MVYISNGELKGQRGRPPCWEAGPWVSYMVVRRPGSALLSTPPGQMELGAKSPRPAAPQPIVPEPAAGTEVPLTTAVPTVRRSRPPGASACGS